MNKITNGTITGFSIVTDNQSRLEIVVSVQVEVGKDLLTKTTKWTAFPAKDITSRLLGLLRVAGVKSTDLLVDSEVRVHIVDGEIQAIGHRSEQRFWQVAPGYLRLVA
ncbi:MAG: hypothetical protein SFV17_05600 [Candidatus Obscuribacter sp.]|nr:hypothetical protein [Candidatus Obscuribacter sp.]